MLEEELLRRGCRVKVLSKLLTKEKSLKALGYIGHVAKQQAAIMASDVVVLDTYCIPASMIPHGKGTRIVQIWHALGAVKKFGWQTVGREGGSSEKVARLMRMHRGDRWRVYIPYQLAYGSSARSSIPAYSTLIFDLQLEDFWRKTLGDRE